MIALSQDSHENVSVFAVHLETAVQAHTCPVHKSLKGILALAMQMEESAIRLKAPAEGNDILLGKPAIILGPSFLVKGLLAFNLIDERLRELAEQIRKHLNLTFVGPGN